MVNLPKYSSPETWRPGQLFAEMGEQPRKIHIFQLTKRIVEDPISGNSGWWFHPVGDPKNRMCCEDWYLAHAMCLIVGEATSFGKDMKQLFKRSLAKCVRLSYALDQATDDGDRQALQAFLDQAKKEVQWFKPPSS